MSAVVFVSVNQSYEPSMSATALARVAHAAWPLTLANGKRMEHLVAAYEGHALMAWPILDVYLSDETYVTTGGDRPRIAFALGAPEPVRPEWQDIPTLRRGVAYDANR